MKYTLCVKLCHHNFTIAIVHKLLVHGHCLESGLHIQPSVQKLSMSTAGQVASTDLHYFFCSVVVYHSILYLICKLFQGGRRKKKEQHSRCPGCQRCQRYPGCQRCQTMKSRHHRKKENPGEPPPLLTNSILLQKTNPGEIAFKHNKYLFNIQY